MNWECGRQFGVGGTSLRVELVLEPGNGIR